MRRLFFTVGPRHARFVSDNAHTPFNPVRLARERSCIEGRLEVNRLPRLADVMLGCSGDVSYRVQGLTTVRGHPALRISLRGELTMTCQRCLEPVSVKLDTERELILLDDVDPFHPDEEEDDDTDVIAIADAGDLEDLLEQELALSLPMVPHHEQGSCPDALQNSDPNGRVSPFSALAGRKTH